MKPKMRAIDMALRLNLDEEGNPKPQIAAQLVKESFIIDENDFFNETVSHNDEIFVDELMPILQREEKKDEFIKLRNNNTPQIKNERNKLEISDTALLNNNLKEKEGMYQKRIFFPLPPLTI